MGEFKKEKGRLDVLALGSFLYDVLYGMEPGVELKGSREVEVNQVRRQRDL